MRLLENGDKCPVHQTLMGQLKNRSGAIPMREY